LVRSKIISYNSTRSGDSRLYIYYDEYEIDLTSTDTVIVYEHNTTHSHSTNYIYNRHRHINKTKSIKVFYRNILRIMDISPTKVINYSVCSKRTYRNRERCISPTKVINYSVCSKRTYRNRERCIGIKNFRRER
jgi:hypothetical protein